MSKYKKGETFFLEMNFIREKGDYLFFNARGAEIGFYKNDIEKITKAEQKIKTATEALEFYAEYSEGAEYWGHKPEDKKVLGETARKALGDIEK